MANMTVRNGVSGILVPLSYKTSEAIEPVLINTQVAVYTDNRNVVVDATATKEIIKKYQEEAVAEKDAFFPKDFLRHFHLEFESNNSRMNLLLGYIYKGKTFPVSVSLEHDGDTFIMTTQIVYTEPMKGVTIDVKLKSKHFPSWENVMEQLLESVPYLEGESLNITDTAFYVKERIDKELPVVVQEVFIKKGSNITIIGG